MEGSMQSYPSSNRQKCTATNEPYMYKVLKKIRCYEVFMQVYLNELIVLYFYLCLYHMFMTVINVFCEYCT